MTMPDTAPAIIQVISAEPAPEPTVTDRPAPAGSAMASLREMRQRKLDAQLRVWPVPRWNDADSAGPLDVRVRFRPVEAAKMESAVENRRRQNPRPKDWAVLANADVLASACVAVFYLDEHGQEKSLRDGDPDGPLTTFDPDLAFSLGVTSKLACDVVRALYITDGDLVATTNALAEWSGIATLRADDAFLSS